MEVSSTRRWIQSNWCPDGILFEFLDLAMLEAEHLLGKNIFISPFYLIFVLGFSHLQLKLS